MPIKSKYLFVASMDVDPDKETLFNEVYDTEHVPNLLKVPGVHAVSRMEGESFVMSIGGEERTVAHDGPRHSAIYEIDGPHVLVSREWAKPAYIPPYTWSGFYPYFPSPMSGRPPKTALGCGWDPGSRWA